MEATRVNNVKPIALVIPWYGDDIRGGAESECNFLAHCLQKAGQSVEVFTSCVKEASSDRGKNTIKPGSYIESGITVRRFPVRENRDLERYNASNARIFHDSDYTLEDEEVYFREDINSEPLYDFIREHRDDYRAFIYMPYMYGITYNGCGIWPEKSIMIPCLHDESYAYMKLLRKKVECLKGMVFLSKPEQELADRLFDLNSVQTVVLGGGVETEWMSDCNAERFRKKYQIYDPFVLYAGRKDFGKKTDELIHNFVYYKSKTSGSRLRLVLLGGGDLPCEIPIEYQRDIIDLGFVSSQDKHDAFFACEVFCNPSWNESFSIVIMEAWLAKRPVIVSDHCAVTRNFAEETNGGLWYNNRQEFSACLEYLLTHKAVAKRMGENGCKYVLSHFEGSKIAENYLRFAEKCGL